MKSIALDATGVELAEMLAALLADACPDEVVRGPEMVGMPSRGAHDAHRATIVVGGAYGSFRIDITREHT